MAEAEPVPDADAGGIVPRAADIEMGPDGLESMDESFLEALPADLRAEMMRAQADLARQSESQPQPSTREEPEEAAQGPNSGQAPAESSGIAFASRQLFKVFPAAFNLKPLV